MKTKQRKKTGYWPGMFVPILALAVVLMTFVMKADSDEIKGCANNPTKSYGGVFDTADFALDDVSAGIGLKLLTGKDAIDPNNIVIPKEQEVWATFFYERAGYLSDFGWFLYKDAVDDKGTPDDKSDDTFIGWDALLAKDKKNGQFTKSVVHPIFISIKDDQPDPNKDKWVDAEISNWERTNTSRGVLDPAYGGNSKNLFPFNDESKIGDITKYNDGSDIPFTVDGNGVVTPLDMRKSLANGYKFEAGTEIVFFLAANHRWNASDKANWTFFTKTEWNPDFYEMRWKYKLKRSDCDTNKNKECSEIFKCFDDAGNADCIETCASDNTNCINACLGNADCIKTCKIANTNCINACYNSADLDACKAAEKQCLETLGCSIDWWTITTSRMVPYDSEIAATVNDPGWLSWDRDRYTYGLPKVINHYIQYDKTSKTYPGLVYQLDTENVYFDPVDPDSPSVGPARFNRLFNLGTACGESWVTTGGWMEQDAITRMDSIFDVTLSNTDTRLITFTNGEKYPHLIVGAPQGEPDQWILGWDDQPARVQSDFNQLIDSDYNDMVFRIELEVMGVAQLTADKAITPAPVTDDNGKEFVPEYTSVTIRVKDYMPACEIGGGAGATEIDYYIALDGGATDASWIKVEWSSVKQYDTKKTPEMSDDTVGAVVENWTSGNPEYTFREGRIDFAELGISGSKLVWKAELRSKHESCIPEIIDVQLEGDVAINAIFSRSSPIVRTNVVYSGTYETPAAAWADKYMRGHLVATRIYDPAEPVKEDGSSATNTVELWDAGVIMNTQEPSARKIYFPELVYKDSDQPENIAKRTVIKDYSGKLAHTVIQAGTLSITDGTETFTDSHTSQLVSDKGGTGTINRFTGEYSLTFKGSVTGNPSITATYKYYETKGLKDFTTENVNATMLNLTDDYVIGDAGRIYKDDIDGDGVFDATKDSTFLVNWTRGYKDGNTTKKPWLLGAIDHSSPAIAHAPGKASWYESLEGDERTAYDTFMETHKQRQSIALVGARDGMLHAFDAGHFRWGDNPKTPDPITEYRGYFEWAENATKDLDDKDYTYGTGKEEWAFIPANLISRLKNNFKKSGTQAFVDASPAVADVYADSAWKSLVFSALGNGGDTIFCLDITNPVVPKLMWEFIDPDLYRSKSSPAVGQVGKVLSGGKSKWVVFFVSGTPTTCSGSDDDPHCYPSVFMIDAADGRVISRIFLDSEVEGKGGVPSGQPAVVDYDGNGYLDAMYVGTSKGFMYKVNLPDESGSVASINDCVINDKVLPIHASPTIVVTKEGVDVFFGTSDNPYESGDSPPGTIYTFYAYRDASGKDGCAKATKKWSLDMPTGHRIFATAFAAAGKIYFGTSTTDTEDPCSTPEVEGAVGRVYMLNQKDGTPITGDGYIEVGNVRSAPVVDDEHLYIKTMDGPVSGASGHMLSVGRPEYNNMPNTIQGKGDIEPQIKWWREVTEKATE